MYFVCNAFGEYREMWPGWSFLRCWSTYKNSREKAHSVRGGLLAALYIEISRNVGMCNKKFPAFLAMHNKAIKRLEESGVFRKAPSLHSY